VEALSADGRKIRQRRAACGEAGCGGQGDANVGGLPQPGERDRGERVHDERDQNRVNRISVASVTSANRNTATQVRRPVRVVCGTPHSSSMSAPAGDGVSWTLIGTETIAMPATVFAGLAVTSHTTGASATCSFDAVAIQEGTRIK
jgi:hypothetical protein